MIWVLDETDDGGPHRTGLPRAATTLSSRATASAASADNSLEVRIASCIVPARALMPAPTTRPRTLPSKPPRCDRAPVIAPARSSSGRGAGARLSGSGDFTSDVSGLTSFFRASLQCGGVRSERAGGGESLGKQVPRVPTGRTRQQKRRRALSHSTTCRPPRRRSVAAVARRRGCCGKSGTAGSDSDSASTPALNGAATPAGAALDASLW